MTEVAAPAPVAPAAQPSAPQSDADFAASLKAEFKPEIDADMSEVDFVWPGDEPKAPKVEPETPPVVEPPVVEPAKPAELNELTTVKQRLQAKEAAELAQKKRADTLEAQLAEAKTAAASFDGMDVHAFLAKQGTSLREVLTKIHKGEMELPDAAPRAPVDPEMETIKAEWKASKEQKAKEDQQKAFETARSSDVQAVTDLVSSSDHQLLKALPGGADQVVSSFYEEMAKLPKDVASDPAKQGEVLQAVVAQSEKNLRESVTALFSNESVIAWLGSQPELYAKLTKTAAPATVQQTTPPIPGKQANGTPVVAAPTTLTPSMGSQVPARSDRKGPVEPSELAAEFNRDIASGKFA